MNLTPKSVKEIVAIVALAAIAAVIILGLNNYRENKDAVAGNPVAGDSKSVTEPKSVPDASPSEDTEPNPPGSTGSARGTEYPTASDDGQKLLQNNVVTHFGTFAVGPDIPAGVYQTQGPEWEGDTCGWAKMSRKIESFNDAEAILASGDAQVPTSLTLKDGEFIEFSDPGCSWEWLG